MAYKIVTKTIVNKLRPLMLKLIGQNQGSFVLRRSINDNVVVAQGAVHSMVNFKGRKWGIVLKIDLE